MISDLHLFARRSQGAECFNSLRPALGSMDVLVLNGDIFDFRWSTIGDAETTVALALDWLRSLVSNLPGCRIHFVVGNHDCSRLFTQQLTRLSFDHPRFQWHEYLLRLGPALFFHGDCAHGRMDRSSLSRFRERWKRDWQGGPFLTRAYQYADRLGITRRVHEWHFPRRETVERIAFYLDDACPGWRAATRDCYFGHTHLPFSNYDFKGIRFHNTGSAIRNMEFKPVDFETQVLMEEGPSD